MGAIIAFRGRDALPVARIARGEVLFREPNIDWRTPDGEPLTLESLRAHYAAVKDRLARAPDPVHEPAPIHEPVNAEKAAVAPPAAAYRPVKTGRPPPPCIAPTIEARRLIRLTAYEAGLDPREIYSPSRYGPVVQARFKAVWRVFQATDWSVKQIGRFFGGRDHSTILHTLRLMAEREGADLAAMMAERWEKRKK